jgi:hypothetical protein
MRFVTRERARVDRIACPWLIRRFIDPQAEFLFVPADQVTAVAERDGAIPFDVPGVRLGHHGSRCSFDAFIEEYRLTDPALLRLAEIVRGADTDDRTISPEASGLYALASGFQALMPSAYADDHALLAAETPMYDALYRFCQQSIR